jgi:hypothetical protein
VLPFTPRCHDAKVVRQVAAGSIGVSGVVVIDVSVVVAAWRIDDFSTYCKRYCRSFTGRFDPHRDEIVSE